MFCDLQINLSAVESQNQCKVTCGVPGNNYIALGRVLHAKHKSVHSQITSIRKHFFTKKQGKTF